MSFSQQAQYMGQPGKVGSGDGFHGQPGAVLLNEKQWGYIQRCYRMSPRELQVARLVCRGFTNGDMAAKLRVKPGTVKTHLRSIFAKVHVRNKITLLLRFLDATGKLSEKPSTFGPIPERTREKPAKGLSAFSQFAENE